MLAQQFPKRAAVLLHRARGLRDVALMSTQGRREKIVLEPPVVDLAVCAALFVVFLGLGTVLFVRHERNR